MTPSAKKELAVWQERLAVALDNDTESGVKWFSSLAAERFKTEYPELHKVLCELCEATL